jgi:hypothetical protein
MREPLTERGEKMTQTALKALIQDVIKHFDCFDELCIDVQWIVEYGDFKVARLQPYARIGTSVVDDLYEMVIQEPKEQTAHAIEEAIAMNKKTISDIIASIKQKFNYTRVKPNLPPMEERK